MGISWLYEEYKARGGANNEITIEDDDDDDTKGRYTLHKQLTLSHMMSAALCNYSLLISKYFKHDRHHDEHGDDFLSTYQLHQELFTFLAPLLITQQQPLFEIHSTQHNAKYSCILYFCLFV